MRFLESVQILGSEEKKNKKGEKFMFVRFLENNGTLFEAFCKDEKVMTSVAQMKPLTLCKADFEITTKDSCMNAFVLLKACYKSGEKK